MNCDRIQAELSDLLDGRRLGAAAKRHLESCADCNEFLSASLEIAERYRSQIGRGLRRLRPPAARRTPRPMAAALALVAVVALLWIAIPKPAVDVVVAPVPVEPSCVRLYDDVPLAAEAPVSLVWIPEAFLPVRLDQDLFPTASEADVLAVLPPGLRF
jgi:hypothetical protein